MWPFSVRGHDTSDAANLVEDREIGEASGMQDSQRGFFSSMSDSIQSSISRGQESFGLGTASNPEDEEITASICPEMSYQTRFYGFLICLSLGTFMSISSSFMAPSIVLKPEKFALPYTLGNILSLGSSMFFVGPKRFASTMCSEARRIASIIYFTSMIITLYTALVMKSAPLTFIFIIIQFSAYIWLMASYIPFGRRMLSSLTQKVASYCMS